MSYIAIIHAHTVGMLCKHNYLNIVEDCVNGNSQREKVLILDIWNTHATNRMCGIWWYDVCMMDEPTCDYWR